MKDSLVKNLQPIKLVSIPLRGIGDERDALPDALARAKAQFPSPYGELVMKDSLVKNLQPIKLVSIPLRGIGDESVDGISKSGI